MSDITSPAPQTLLIVTYDVDEQEREAFERIAGAHAAASDTYAGCSRFSLGRDILHPGRYQLVEQWRSLADLEAHGRSNAFRETMAALAECHTLTVQPDRYDIVPAAPVAL
jgi:quinol monooxygenase YgiN